MCAADRGYAGSMQTTQEITMKLKAGFLFLTATESGDDGPTWVKTRGVDLLVIPVNTYSEAEEKARWAVEEEGCAALELCGGFGNEGAARIARCVSVPVGTVRFDVHPGLGNASGDTMFDK